MSGVVNDGILTPEIGRPALSVTFADSYSALPRALIPIDTTLTQLSFATVLPGGNGDASIGMAEDESGKSFAFLPEPTDARLFDHMEIAVGPRVIWEGRVTHRRRPGGYTKGVDGTGYLLSAADDDWFDGGASQQATALDVLTSAIVATQIPIQIGPPTHMIDPATLYTSNDYKYQTVADMLDAMSTAGGAYGSASVPWYPSVYEDRILRWMPEVLIGNAKYTVPMDESIIIEDDAQDLWGEVTLQWTNIAGINHRLHFVDPVFSTRFPGVTRHKFIDTAFDTSSAAAAFAQTFLNEHSSAPVSCSLTRDYTRGLELTGGGYQPTWLIRAGEWVQIQGLDPMIIMSTSFDGADGACSVTLGKPTPRRIARYLYEAIKTSRALARRRDPVSKNLYRLPVPT